MRPPLRWSLEKPELIVGWVRAHELGVRESDERLRELMDRRVADPSSWGLDDDTGSAVRDLLRGSGYKPSGRGKPASEYLAAAARKGRFPRVFNVVDINNLVSLETGWPASVLDLDRARGDGADLELRIGAPGESFVFNDAGQEIDIGGLLSVARVGGTALANPVKDSMTAKLVPGTTRSVLAVLYTSSRVASPEEVDAATRRYGDLLQRHAGAGDLSRGTLTEPGTAD